MSSPVNAASGNRLAVLDLLRLFAIVEIIGFHWLRTCQQNGTFGLVWKQAYEDVWIGFGQLGYLLTDQSGLSIGSVANNLIGLLFGTGWQAVDVFILLSGLTLALHYRPGRPGFSDWHWRLRRFTRILAPYYGIAFLLIAAAELFRLLAAGEGGPLHQMVAKLAGKNLADPIGVLALKHLFLLDVRQPFWIAEPFSPAWWFIPPILVGYLTFPTIYRAVARLGTAWALIIAASVSVAAYMATDAGLLPERGWYYVVLHECFGFTLGIVLGRALAEPESRERLLCFLRSRRGLGLGCALFLAGNLANWFRESYPFASLLFTPGLTLMLGWAAGIFERSARMVAGARRTDLYHVYLLHQFPAFPVAVLAGWAAGSHARAMGFSLGFLAYLAVVIGVVLAFDLALNRLKRISAKLLSDQLNTAGAADGTR